MVDYKVTVYTGKSLYATTLNNIFIKLVSTFTMSCPVSVGKLILIELDKKRLPQFPEDYWFPAKVKVESPDGETYNFPIYRGITDSENGHIFLLDYKGLDGLKANIVHEKQHYLIAPLVLLHKTPDDKPMPIAIQYVASGGEALSIILQRSTFSITYKSLCMPEDIAERGMEDLPNYYYRDDGLMLWAIIQRFVEGVLSFYYKSDEQVQHDLELQKWISDIFEHGFLSLESTGIPKGLSSVAELVKFVTMVLFTCSAQHSAVNDGQFDYGGWMPNTPFSLQLAPPTTKGTTSEATIENRSDAS
ncbi:hypothetical protein NQZ68_006171 [Dissostichus eleginoides]|nr:hypothetical protein NQZ68_006171 [Dissostichus eleginoides]